ncbi:MAG: tetratricopeptide repeat protein [bacterium]|nr:tetratricopeptide repeat protein [Candidatus Limimorpha equi]
MKKLTFIVLAIFGLAITGCNNIEKSRNYYDEGVSLMMRKGDFAEAEKCFTKAIKYDKTNPELYYYRGCAKFNEGNYREAIGDFEKAIEIKPDYADAYFTLGRTYSVMHDTDMSCYYYKMAEKYGRPNLHDLIKYCPD